MYEPPSNVLEDLASVSPTIDGLRRRFGASLAAEMDRAEREKDAETRQIQMDFLRSSEERRKKPKPGKKDRKSVV